MAGTSVAGGNRAGSEGGWGSNSRVTLVAPRTRVDLALPSDVPFADLLAHAAALRRRRPRRRPHAKEGWALTRLGGVSLDSSRTPAQLDVRDGELLYLRPRGAEAPSWSSTTWWTRWPPPPSSAPAAGGRRPPGGSGSPGPGGAARRRVRRCCSPARRSCPPVRSGWVRRPPCCWSACCCPGRSATPAPGSRSRWCPVRTPASAACWCSPATGRWASWPRHTRWSAPPRSCWSWWSPRSAWRTRSRSSSAAGVCAVALVIGTTICLVTGAEPAAGRGGGGHRRVRRGARAAHALLPAGPAAGPVGAQRAGGSQAGHRDRRR